MGKLLKALYGIRQAPRLWLIAKNIIGNRRDGPRQPTPLTTTSNHYSLLTKQQRYFSLRDQNQNREARIKKYDTPISAAEI